MAKDKEYNQDEFDDDLDDIELDDGKESPKAEKAVKGGAKADPRKAKTDVKKKDANKKKVAKFFRDLRGEFKKIIWPTRKTVIRNTSVTIAMCAIVGIAVAVFDFGLGALVSLLTQQKISFF